MFNNLEAELKRNRITRADLAKELGLNITTVSEKLTKEGRLKLEEAVKIQEVFFPQLGISYLFENEKPKA